MTSSEIRKAFMDFFASKQHKIVPSAPIVNKDDPTLMFTNAGMNQFKDYFLGNQAPAAPRIADTQKCLRVSGKHNDLEEVGVDSYHHTMFEMLGNWSFGDYFKKEAIAWAWELLTGVYKLPKDRLYASIFEGDKAENLEIDQEAIDFWKEWIPEDRILPFDKKDNFWEMGDTGPCGPCSEIHIDLRSDTDRQKVDGKTLVNADHPLVIEIWNLVFIQFNRKADGSLEELPEKHVDTGMGFERLCMAIQRKQSNYDTDVFTPLIEAIEKASGVKYDNTYDPGKKKDIAMRVIADHLRAVSFAIADGQLPENDGPGYVIKRILRRAIRYYYSFLNINEPFIHQFVPLLVGQFGDVFPELKEQKLLIYNIIEKEEETFLKTLASGIRRLENFIEHQKVKNFDSKFEEYLNQNNITFTSKKHLKGPKEYTLDYFFSNENIGLTFSLPKTGAHKKMFEHIFKDVKIYHIEKKNFVAGQKTGVPIVDNFSFQGQIDGETAFELFATYGFPIDLTRLIASEKGWTVDEDGFEKALTAHKEISKGGKVYQVDDWFVLQEDQEVEFVGYDQLVVENAGLIKYRTVNTGKEDQYQIVLQKTPFYAESGGQVGDKGLLWFGEEKVPVIDTVKENELIIHLVKNLPKDINQPVKAEVNRTKRKATEKNHTATHLMHSALHRVLGEHALQKGQNVDDKRLRFDFSHSQQVSAEELLQIERMVNSKIRENISLEENRGMPIEEAKAAGAMMLFGEKYGDLVRMITFDKDYSRELCGGTHVEATGEIGQFKIVGESAVAAGIRRIEAVTAEKAETLIEKELDELNQIRAMLKSKDTANGIAKLIEENKKLQKEVEKLLAAQAGALKGELINKAEALNGVNLIVAKLPLGDSNAIKTLAYQIEGEVDNAVIVFGAVVKDKPQLMITINKELVGSKGLNAGTMIRELAKEIQGGGGGQPFFATAGGKNADGLDAALAKAKSLVS